MAVHCRAGLGRTGTLIALWMMRRAGFDADSAVGWLRVVRPGSVIGSQHSYLRACERRRWDGNSMLPTPSNATCDASRIPIPGFAAAEAVLAEQFTASMCRRGIARAGACRKGGKADFSMDGLPQPSALQHSHTGGVSARAENLRHLRHDPWDSRSYGNGVRLAATSCSV